jgi:ATP-dependent RNA helicase DHX8/PRP22
MTSIDMKWLVGAALMFLKVARTDKVVEEEEGGDVQPLYNRFAAERDWRLSA